MAGSFFGKLLDKIGGWKGAAAIIGCAIIGSMIIPGAGFFIGALLGGGGAYMIKKRAESRGIGSRAEEGGKSAPKSWAKEPEQEKSRGKERSIEGPRGNERPKKYELSREEWDRVQESRSPSRTPKGKSAGHRRGQGRGTPG